MTQSESIELVELEHKIRRLCVLLERRDADRLIQLARQRALTTVHLTPTSALLQVYDALAAGEEP